MRHRTAIQILFLSLGLPAAVSTPTAARCEETPSAIIVRFEQGVTAEEATNILLEAGAEMRKLVSSERNTFLATTGTRAALTRTLALLSKNPRVIFAEEETIHAIRRDKAPVQAESE